MLKEEIEEVQRTKEFKEVILIESKKIHENRNTEREERKQGEEKEGKEEE